MILILILFGIPSILLSVDFVHYLVTGKRLYHSMMNHALEIGALILLPLFYLRAIDYNTNDCCSDSATFSPDHSLIIYVLIITCVVCYFVSTFKKVIISPIIETLINSILLGGIVFNVFIALQIEQPFWLLGNLPIIILFVFELIKNHGKISEYSLTLEHRSLNKLEKLSWNILNSKLFIKIPTLLILFLPILTVLSGFLLLFGQKPDSIIRAFTDTYKHGLSQLDYMCDNVQCGDHFLCSVAANGHKRIVAPQRLGERRGNKIMCNRQLLIANAFEELIEEKIPKTHRSIRNNYNKVGNLIHRYYTIFNIKIVADIVYVLMKPLEWFFIITLYTFDQKPENRIAKQYLKPLDRKKIEDKTAYIIP